MKEETWNIIALVSGYGLGYFNGMYEVSPLWALGGVVIGLLITKIKVKKK